MREFVLVLFFALIIFGCNSSSENSETVKNEEELIMAPRSEMAILMNEMYAFNESIKEQIISGELNNDFPDNFNKIQTAVLTKPSVRDAAFESYSSDFISKTKNVFETPHDNLVDRYNEAVNSCISCHNDKCVGPIPRIKKLLIQ